MSMHFVYLLYSSVLCRYYIGESENLEQRLTWHNEHLFNKSSTIIASDWQLMKTIIVGNRNEARIIEGYIKSMKSSKFLDKLIRNEVFSEGFKNRVKEKFGIQIL